MYFINLRNLGILDAHENKWLDDQEQFNVYLENNIKILVEKGEFDKFKEECDLSKISFIRCFYLINQFGQLFFKSLS